MALHHAPPPADSIEEIDFVATFAAFVATFLINANVEQYISNQEFDLTLMEAQFEHLRDSADEMKQELERAAATEAWLRQENTEQFNRSIAVVDLLQAQNRTLEEVSEQRRSYCVAASWQNAELELTVGAASEQLRITKQSLEGERTGFEERNHHLRIQLAAKEEEAAAKEEAAAAKEKRLIGELEEKNVVLQEQSNREKTLEVELCNLKNSVSLLEICRVLLEEEKMAIQKEIREKEEIEKERASRIVELEDNLAKMRKDLGDVKSQCREMYKEKREKQMDIVSSLSDLSVAQETIKATKERLNEKRKEAWEAAQLCKEKENEIEALQKAVIHAKKNGTLAWVLFAATMIGVIMYLACKS